MFLFFSLNSNLLRFLIFFDRILIILFKIFNTLSRENHDYHNFFEKLKSKSNDKLTSFWIPVLKIIIFIVNFENHSRDMCLHLGTIFFLICEINLIFTSRIVRPNLCEKNNVDGRVENNPLEKDCRFKPFVLVGRHDNQTERRKIEGPEHVCIAS